MLKDKCFEIAEEAIKALLRLNDAKVERIRPCFEQILVKETEQVLLLNTCFIPRNERLGELSPLKWTKMSVEKKKI
jgi:hypothetical protein